MLQVTLAAVVVAALGLYLAYRVVKAHTSPPAEPSPWRRTLMDLLIQAAGWSALLLSVAVGFRDRHLPAPDARHERTLRRILRGRPDRSERR